MAPPADAILAFASAFPLAILGGLLLYLRPRHAPQVFFGLFAIVWAGNIALANLGRIQVDPALHRTLLPLSLVFLSVAALFLVHFALTIQRRRYDWIVSAIVATLVLVGNLVLVLRPDLVIVAVTLEEGALTTEFGPLVFPFFHGLFRVATYLALVVMYFEYRQAKRGTPRRRIRGILMALALYASYDTARLLLFYLLSDDGFGEFSSSAVQTTGGLIDLASTVILLAGSALLVALAVHAFVRPPPPEEPDTSLLVAFIFPALVAALEEGLALVDIPLETLGFWRFLAVGVVVFTLANYQLFDLELKLKRVAAPIVAGLLVLFGIPILLTLALGEFGLTPIIFTVIPEVVGVAGIMMFQDRVKQALFPGVDDSPDYLHQRRLEIYRVALEDALQRGAKPDDPKLKELRLKNGITDQEHSILTWMLTSGKPATPRGTETFEEGNVVLDRYRLRRTLGRGSYGRTLLAEDVRSHREVALKTVSVSANEGTAAQLLLREARLAAGIDHPNVVDILDVAELPDRVVVVMEYADSGNLDDYMKRTGHLSLPDAVRLLRELLAALEAVHAKGIVHRNLKPKNILIEADDSVRLSDFGAAWAGQAGEATTEMATQTLLDLLYQSPEQLGGEPATPQSDLFVAAVLFHYAATGRLPYAIAGKSDYHIRETIRNQSPEWHLDELPAWSRGFLEKAMARDPAGRFADAAAMRAALEEAAGLRRGS